GADDDVGEAIAVDVAGCHVGPPREADGEGEKVEQRRAVLAVADDDIRPTARSGGGDNVSDAVVVHVAHRYADAAGEVRVVSEEVEKRGAGGGGIDLHVRPAARVRSGRKDVDPRRDGTECPSTHDGSVDVRQDHLRASLELMAALSGGNVENLEL